MPLLTVQNLKVVSQKKVNFKTLDDNDSFVFSPSNTQLLLIRNNTGAEVNATIIGDESLDSVTCQGVGLVSVEEEPIDVEDGGDASLYLNAIPAKLRGTVEITGGAGLEVAFVQL